MWFIAYLLRILFLWPPQPQIIKRVPFTKTLWWPCSHVTKKQVAKSNKKGGRQRMWKDIDQPHNYRCRRTVCLPHVRWSVDINSCSASCFSTEISIDMAFSCFPSFFFPPEQDSSRQVGIRHTEKGRSKKGSRRSMPEWWVNRETVLWLWDKDVKWQAEQSGQMEVLFSMLF